MEMQAGKKEKYMEKLNTRENYCSRNSRPAVFVSAYKEYIQKQQSIHTELKTRCQMWNVITSRQ